MPGLRQGYTSVCREDACYLDTGLGVAVLQADGYEEQSDPAQTCLWFPLTHPAQAKTAWGLPSKARSPGPAFP